MISSPQTDQKTHTTLLVYGDLAVAPPAQAQKSEPKKVVNTAMKYKIAAVFSFKSPTISTNAYTCNQDGCRVNTRVNHSSLSGFTLLELLIVISLVGILLSLTGPSFQSMVSGQRQQSQMHAFTSVLHYARSEAVTRNTTTTLCGSNNQIACNTSEWEGGWILFSDANQNIVVDGTDTILKVGTDISNTTTIRRQISSSGNIAFTQFNSTGTSDLDPQDSASFTLCGLSGNTELAEAININGRGRILMASDTNSPADEVVNNNQGNNVTCP